MGLKRFDYKLPGQRKNFKQIAIVLCICLIAVLSFTSYALYEVRHPNDFVNSKVGEFNTSDVSITVLVDGVKSDAFPTKNSGKSFLDLSCTNGGSASWDKTNWKLSIKDITGPTECTISFGTLYADASGAEQPELNNGMIPVTYDKTTDKWVKADTSTKWYDYDTQWWANAVTVSASSRATYTSAAANTPIEMNDIETMWVWVPRYEYNSELLKTPANYGGTAENPGTQTQPKGIEINFISKDTVSSSSSNFTIHDAFKWGDEEASKEQLAGIWVAKFEMSTGATSCTAGDYSVGTGCDLTTITPQIKPNVTSWRGARIGTLWTAINRNMNGTNNQYGLTNTDAHLMKNMEWGAVAYLSQSKYGKYGNSSYTGANKEIYQNKSSNFITGSSNGTPSSSTTNTQIAYNVEGAGTGASTTGNIYGIYDMSGGAYEYVMGVMKVNGSNEPAVGYSTSWTSGWSGKLYDGTQYPAEGDTTTKTHGSLNNDVPKRYYDLYEYGTSYTDYTRGKLGDATKEVIASDSASTQTGWYSDFSLFVHSNYPFFLRGGSYGLGSNVGVFVFNRGFGNAYSHNGGRLVAVHQAS